MDDKTNGPQTVGAYEAKTRFSELIARAEKGESFLVTKNGRPVAQIVPTSPAGSHRAKTAGARLLARLDAAPVVTEEQAQLNYEQMKATTPAHWMSGSIGESDR